MVSMMSMMPIGFELLTLVVTMRVMENVPMTTTSLRSMILMVLILFCDVDADDNDTGIVDIYFDDCENAYDGDDYDDGYDYDGRHEDGDAAE